MPYRVRIEPSGREFTVAGGDTLLEAALRAGLPFDYGCSNGNCGSCTVRLLDGRVSAARHHDFVIPEAERLAGAVLACAVAPDSDLVIDAGHLVLAARPPEQQVTGQLIGIERLADGPAIVTLRTPRSRRLRFLAGQHVALALPGQAAQRLPIASCPCEESRLRFHLLSGPGSPVAAALLGGAVKRFDELTVTGPYGDFVLDDNDASAALLLVAIGTGFAPVQALIEQALALDEERRIDLVRFPTPGSGHYLDNLCRSWQDAFDSYHYHPLDAGALDDPATATRLQALLSRAGGTRLFIAGPAPAAARTVALFGALIGAEYPLRITSTGIHA